MDCESESDPVAPEPTSMHLHDLGEGPLWTILSFCTLSDVAQVSCVDRTLSQLCQGEWKMRDAVMEAKSCASTPRQRLRRWALADTCARRATKALRSSSESLMFPQHVFLKPPSEIMLHLYSQSKRSLLWRGFLPCLGRHDSNEQQSSGWQVDLETLGPIWTKLVQSSTSKSDSNRSPLDRLSHFVEDLWVVLVHVSDKATPTSSCCQVCSSTCQAHLITCTAGVALCQRPNAAHAAAPTTFVLRQQWVAHVPVVVHLSIRAHADVLDEMQVLVFRYLY